MNTPTTFTIPVSAWADFVAKIAKLNKRAAKLGCDPITYATVSECEVTRRHTVNNGDGDFTRSYKVPARTIELSGSAPKLDGWQFIARVEYLSDSKSTLFHTVPGTDTKIDERFRTLSASVCEHCNKSRARKDTFIVRNVATDGAQMQVGRQCLADFTGINSPEKIAAKAAWLSSFTDLRDFESNSWGSHFANTLDRQHVLALTSAYIARVGWTPKSAASEMNTATASNVADHFFAPPKDAARVASLAEIAALAEQPEHVERAARVVAWVKDELSTKARSDYEMNLVTLVAGELIETKHLGIVCSAVAAYQRAMNQKVEYASKRAALANSQHVGTVGERVRGVAVKVHQVRAMEGGAWGPCTLVKFIDDAGNLLTWFASSDRDYQPGAVATLDATIKGHSEYNGVKETKLSRAKVHFAEAVAA